MKGQWRTLSLILTVGKMSGGSEPWMITCWGEGEKEQKHSYSMVKKCCMCVCVCVCVYVGVGGGLRSPQSFAEKIFTRTPSDRRTDTDGRVDRRQGTHVHTYRHTHTHTHLYVRINNKRKSNASHYGLYRHTTFLIKQKNTLINSYMCILMIFHLFVG